MGAPEKIEEIANKIWDATIGRQHGIKSADLESRRPTMSKKETVPANDQGAPGLPILPLNDQIVVEIIKEGESKGGIVLPTKTVSSGYIRSIGAGVDKTKYPLEPGQKIFFPRGVQSGHLFQDTYLLLSVSHCIGTLP